jgi:hypothetical protein
MIIVDLGDRRSLWTALYWLLVKELFAIKNFSRTRRMIGRARPCGG